MWRGEGGKQYIVNKNTEGMGVLARVRLCQEKVMRATNPRDQRSERGGKTVDQTAAAAALHGLKGADIRGVGAMEKNVQHRGFVLREISERKGLKEVHVK